MIARKNFFPDEAGADLTVGLLHPHALAPVALLRLDLVLSTAALALAAHHPLVGCKLDGLALVELLKCDLVLLLLVGTLARPPGHAGAAHVHAEHLGKDIIEVDFGAARSSARGIKGSHAMGIVEVALLLIAQNFVGLRYGLELRFGFRSLLLGDLVRMVLQGSLKNEFALEQLLIVIGLERILCVKVTDLAVRLLDVVLASRLINAEQG